MRVLYPFHPHASPQKDIFFLVVCARRHNARTIDQIDSFHQSDVLPHLGFAGDRGDGADFLLAEGVDDGRFAGVGVADEPDGDLFAVGVEGGELPEELDEGAFAEGVCDGGMEGEGRMGFTEVADPGCLRGVPLADEPRYGWTREDSCGSEERYVQSRYYEGLHLSTDCSGDIQLKTQHSLILND